MKRKPSAKKTRVRQRHEDRELVGLLTGKRAHRLRRISTLPISTLFKGQPIALTYGANVVAGSLTPDLNPKDKIASEKVPLGLLSENAKAHWAFAQFVGMCKYGQGNYRAIPVKAMVYASALERHLDGFKSGEEFDPADGTHHLGAIMACCAILIDAKAAGKLIDDRLPSLSIRDTYAYIEKQMGVIRKKYADKKPRHFTIADTEQLQAAQ